MHAWQMREAKARLSELVKCAESEGPQNITLHGQSVAVVISRSMFTRLTGNEHFFGGRILPLGSLVADRWGRLLAAAGRPLPAIDSLLGATAAQHGLRMVTRNTLEFTDMGLDVINR